MADTSDLRRDRRHLLLFLGVTFTVSLAIEIAILRAGGLEAAGALPVLALMWTPGLVALAMRARLRDLPDAGFRLGRPRFLLTAYLLPVGVGALAYGAAWVTHLAPFRVPDAWAARGVPLNILLRVSVGVVVGSIFALGEEIGWRGLMVPLLVRVRAPAPLVLSGIIWGPLAHAAHPVRGLRHERSPRGERAALHARHRGRGGQLRVAPSGFGERVAGDADSREPQRLVPERLRFADGALGDVGVAAWLLATGRVRAVSSTV